MRETSGVGNAGALHLTEKRALVTFACQNSRTIFI